MLVRPLHELEIPSHVSCLASDAAAGLLVAGADDGSARIYYASSTKVAKAIRGLGGEVSSAVFAPVKGRTLGDLWLASGTSIYLFNLDSDRLVLQISDAVCALKLGADDEDVLNELALSSNCAHLAFTTDSGTVGVVEVATQQASEMKTKHSSICGTVKFIPDRSSEIVSGGCDSALLHFDFHRRAVLSRHDIAASSPFSGVSLSPPFILCSALSSSGLIAAGTADGQLWLGWGGEKHAGGKKKRSRKWDGLAGSQAIQVKIAEGPVVALLFVDADALISCTLLGSVTQHSLSRSGENASIELRTVWTRSTTTAFKVNAMALSGHIIAIGGFKKDGKGIVEVWMRNESQPDVAGEPHGIV